MPEATNQVLERLTRVEMNQAFHDESIEALERTIASQHQDIQLLEKKIALLSDYIKSLKQDSIKDPKDEVPPPHY
ncbi:SlyX family protein [Thiomicrorhabdus lithotrophica]|uniref:SlyX family protein n=1 Tax=Thiomicrorhabdus lithotrophica TaxID=2949997 RepID=A0ABY8CE25_9GAMM|nr:SlyX family protein [Thiomicrorhabdus lithotrophica]WEJ63747.1 SlyX family protein [Thiomicrorhabdus lithotrophica]